MCMVMSGKGIDVAVVFDVDVMIVCVNFGVQLVLLERNFQVIFSEAIHHPKLIPSTSTLSLQEDQFTAMPYCRNDAIDGAKDCCFYS